MPHYLKIAFRNLWKYKTQTLTGIIIAVFAVIWILLWNNRSKGLQELSVVEDILFIQDIPEGWESLFDGNTLSGWEIVQYGGEGEPYAKNGILVLPMAVNGSMTGVCWVGDSLPVNNYVIYYEARRVEGHDIFAGLSFPYGDTFASLILGGWAGIVNGLSCINGYDASENETTRLFSLKDNEWYPVQLCVTTDSIRATVGSDQVVDMATAGKKIHLRGGLMNSGLTLWTYLSTGEIRNLRIKKLQ